MDRMKNAAFELCDMGFLNDTIKGYLVNAMQRAGFSDDDIRKAYHGLHYAFDEKTAEEAAEIGRRF